MEETADAQWSHWVLNWNAIADNALKEWLPEINTTYNRYIYFYDICIAVAPHHVNSVYAYSLGVIAVNQPF